MYGKSIRRADIEGDFEKLLKTLQPTEGLFKVATAMFRDYWNTKVEQTIAHAKIIKADILDIEKQIDQLVDRTLEATNARVIAAYEKRIDECERKKLVLAENASKTHQPQPDFDGMPEHALKFLANPHGIWTSGKFNLKRMVLKLAFTEPLLYCRETGYRTPKTSIPFKVLGSFNGQNCKMVPPVGIEPTLP